MIVTVQHLHTVPTWNGRLGFCHSMSREFFKRYGLDWRGFLEHGIDEELLLATGDALAITLVKHAREVGDGQ